MNRRAKDNAKQRRTATTQQRGEKNTQLPRNELLTTKTKNARGRTTARAREGGSVAQPAHETKANHEANTGERGVQCTAADRTAEKKMTTRCGTLRRRVATTDPRCYTRHSTPSQMMAGRLLIRTWSGRLRDRTGLDSEHRRQRRRTRGSASTTRWKRDKSTATDLDHGIKCYRRRGWIRVRPHYHCKTLDSTVDASGKQQEDWESAHVDTVRIEIEQE